MLRVKECHRAFNYVVRNTPSVGSLEDRKLRASLILEETLEYCKAAGLRAHVYPSMDDHRFELIECGNPNIVEIADALADIDYVVKGSNLVHGIDDEPVAEEVHRANMSKRGAYCSACDQLLEKCATDNYKHPFGTDCDQPFEVVLKPIWREDGKFLKGPDYVPPDIAQVLRNQLLYESGRRFENRTRMSFDEAMLMKDTEVPGVKRHIVKNEDDGSWSLMSHEATEMCDYCLAEQDGREDLLVARKDHYREVSKIQITTGE